MENVVQEPKRIYGRNKFFRIPSRWQDKTVHHDRPETNWKALAYGIVSKTL